MLLVGGVVPTLFIILEAFYLSCCGRWVLSFVFKVYCFVYRLLFLTFDCSLCFIVGLFDVFQWMAC